MEDSKKTMNDIYDIFDEDFEKKLKDLLNSNRVDNMSNIVELLDYNPYEDNEDDIKDINEDISTNKYKADIFKKRLMDVDYDEPCIDQWINEYNHIINNMPNNQTKDISNFDLKYLKDLHKINYLTFSLFANQFFEHNIINSSQNHIQNDPDFSFDSKSKNIKISEEDEHKIKHIINYNPDNIEPNEDLFLNIAQGFLSFDEVKKDYENLLESTNKQYNELLPKVNNIINKLPEGDKKKNALESISKIKNIEDMPMLKLKKLKDLEKSIK